MDARPLGAAVGSIGGQCELQRPIVGLIDAPRDNVKATDCTAKYIVMFLFIVGGALLSATRFAASAIAADGPRPHGNPSVVSAAIGT